MSNYYDKVYFDRFAHMFVTEKDPFAAPERYLEISKSYLHQLHEQIKDQGDEINFLKGMQARLAKSIPEEMLGQMVSNVLPR